MASYILCKVLLLVLITYIHTGIDSSQRFEIKTNKNIKEEFTYFGGTSTSVMHCAALCAIDESCMSASYNGDDEFCVLSTYGVEGPSGRDRLTLETSWTVISRMGCSVGWYEVGQTCYYFEQEWTNYTEAKKYCEEMSGKLGEPQTNATYQLLRTFLLGNQNISNHYWIGLNNLNNGSFVWASNGVAPTYTAWSHHEPYDWAGFNCTYTASFEDYRWVSNPCDEIAGVICEM